MHTFIKENYDSFFETPFLKPLPEENQSLRDSAKYENLAFAAQIYEPWFYVMSGILVSILLSVFGWFYIIIRLNKKKRIVFYVFRNIQNGVYLTEEEFENEFVFRTSTNRGTFLQDELGDQGKSSKFRTLSFVTCVKNLSQCPETILHDPGSGFQTQVHSLPSQKMI